MIHNNRILITSPILSSGVLRNLLGPGDNRLLISYKSLGHAKEIWYEYNVAVIEADYMKKYHKQNNKDIPWITVVIDPTYELLEWSINGYFSKGDNSVNTDYRKK